ncbi:MAG TPA: hypothetical protein VGQ83_18460 [Polyangia bacterium]
MVDEIRGATDIEAARTIIRPHVHNEDVAEALLRLIRWKPEYYHLTEDKYQDGLRKFLSKSGYEGRIVEKPPLTWRAEGPKAQEGQDRLARPDFVLGDPRGPDKRRVLVELKGDLCSSADVDRALGQMLRYLLAWKEHGGGRYSSSVATRRLRSDS